MPMKFPHRGHRLSFPVERSEVWLRKLPMLIYAQAPMSKDTEARPLRAVK